MIIVGYQGVGKSTLAMKSKDYIDLESGNFWVDGQRAENWYIPYCQIAYHLSKQGYVVFVSSHECVRNQLAKMAEDSGNSREYLAIVHPDLILKDPWIQKLKYRYYESGLEKDYKAWKNAEDRYAEDIKELMRDSRFDIWAITTMDYNLDSRMDHIRNWSRK